MIRITTRGSFQNSRRFLNKMSRWSIRHLLEQYGELGVEILASATPKGSGRTAASWTYEVEVSRGSSAIYWSNSHMNKGVNIALILDTGHGTGTGGYIRGREYIDPSVSPILDELAAAAWKEVTSA